MRELNERVTPPDPGRTAVGVLGLALAALAACCIPLGILTWMISWYAIAPLAAAGLYCSAFGRRWPRAAGLLLNLLLLLFGIGFYAVLASQRG